jgi:hypothetical protein
VERSGSSGPFLGMFFDRSVAQQWRDLQFSPRNRLLQGRSYLEVQVRVQVMSERALIGIRPNFRSGNQSHRL